MTDPNLTHLVLILDRSGSMKEHNKASEAEKGVRSLLEEQSVLPGQLEVSVARFDDQYELLLVAVRAAGVPDAALTIEPRGMTALYDAVGRTVVAVGSRLAERPDELRPGRVVVLVATDGRENASTEYTAETLRALIGEQTSKYGWEFMFMGTSEEAVLQARSAGFTGATSFATTDTAEGVASSYAVASNSVTRARTKGGAVEVNDEDRESLR